MSQQNYLTVTQLNDYINQKFVSDDKLNTQVFLTGEISNFRLRDKHQYFRLKDDNSVISAVLFASQFSKLKFELEEGLKVFAVGTVSTYTQSGQYQFYVQTMEPDGVGQLFQQYKQTKKRLADAGLFDEAHKKALPKYPKKIGVVTSPNGAVIRDIIKTVGLRYPLAQVVLYPAVVQGEKSAPDLLRQLKRVESRDDIDTIIIGRGGGSIEDLSPFNDEQLAYEIYNSDKPIISSVGHQTDFTIADFVADQRAATPTAAAEFATPDLKHMQSELQSMRETVKESFRHVLQIKAQDVKQLSHQPIFEKPTTLYQPHLARLDLLRTQLISGFEKGFQQKQRQYEQLHYDLLNQHPEKRLVQYQHRLDQLSQRMTTLMRELIQAKQSRYEMLASSLRQLNPTSIMSNGYAYAVKDGQGVNSVDTLTNDDVLTLNFKDGKVTVRVTDIRKDDK